jgi:hypothetical protein
MHIVECVVDAERDWPFLQSRSPIADPRRNCLAAKLVKNAKVIPSIEPEYVDIVWVENFIGFV